MSLTAGRSRVARRVVAYLATAIAGGDLFAQAPKVGVEIQVNSYITGRQERASAAMDDDGDFVVVWESLDQDGNLDGVFAQRFDATGARKGIEFQVNAYTTGPGPTNGIQDQPGVAMDADGDFVVVWRSFSQDGNSDGVFARRYDSAGATIGADFQVNSFTTGQQRSPAVAMADDGAFVAAWESNVRTANRSGSSRVGSTAWAPLKPSSSRSTRSSTRRRRCPRSRSAAPAISPSPGKATSRRALLRPGSSLSATTRPDRRKPRSSTSTPTHRTTS